MTPASGSKLSSESDFQVSDSDFKKLVAVLRLSVPTAGMIITAREKAEIKKEVIRLGCTRITSYNVCYTKLLRDGELETRVRLT